MKFTALIAEDEVLLAENLRQELQGLWPELQIVAMAAHGQAAVDAALNKRPDVCFLDIRMPGMTGLEAAAAMAEDWPADQEFPLLVFVTAYDQYAVQAFERSAIDYVLKPVQTERLAQTCERLKKALSSRQVSQSPSPAAPSLSAPAGVAASLELALQQLRQLLGPTANASQAKVPGLAAAAPSPAPLRLLQVGLGNTIHMVPVDEVLYFEAADKYVRVLTAHKEHLVRISLARAIAATGHATLLAGASQRHRPLGCHRPRGPR